MSVRIDKSFKAFSVPLVLLACSGASADTYRDHERHYSLTIPAGWQAMGPDELQKLNGGRPATPWTPKLMITAGFRPEDRPLGSGPYAVVIAYDPETLKAGGPGCSQDTIIQRFALAADGSVNQKQGTLLDLARGLPARDFTQVSPLGGGVVDVIGHRIINRYRVRLRSGTAMEQLNVVHLGAAGFVTVQSTYRGDEAEEQFPIAVQLNESFRFDDGHGYSAPPPEEPAASAPAAPVWRRLVDEPSLTNVGVALAVVLCGGSLVGIVACLVTSVLRKKAQPILEEGA